MLARSSHELFGKLRHCLLLLKFIIRVGFFVTLIGTLGCHICVGYRHVRLSSTVGRLTILVRNYKVPMLINFIMNRIHTDNTHVFFSNLLLCVFTSLKCFIISFLFLQFSQWNHFLVIVELITTTSEAFWHEPSWMPPLLQMHDNHLEENPKDHAVAKRWLPLYFKNILRTRLQIYWQEWLDHLHRNRKLNSCCFFLLVNVILYNLWNP